MDREHIQYVVVKTTKMEDISRTNRRSVVEVVDNDINFCKKEITDGVDDRRTRGYG